MGPSMEIMYQSFEIIKSLCILNCMFFISQLLQLVFLKKINRTYEFPTISFFTDLILMVTSIFKFQWIVTNINFDIDPSIDS